MDTTSSWSTLSNDLVDALKGESQRLAAVEKTTASAAESRVELARAASRTQRVGESGRGVAVQTHQAELARAENLRAQFTATRAAVTAATADLDEFLSGLAGEL